MTPEEKIKRAGQVAVIAGVFTALVALLLLLNYMQIRASEPLESKALEALVARLSADPGNHELMEEVRQLDLLARKAYFNSLWQIRTGAYLLLFGAIVLVAALRIRASLRFAIDPPEADSYAAGRSRKLSQRWLFGAVAALVLLSAWAAFFSADHLGRFRTDGPEPALATLEGVGIETIDIRPAVREVESGEEESGDALAAGGKADEAEETAGEDGTRTTEREDRPRETTASASPGLTEEAVLQNHNSFRGPWGNAVSPHRSIPSQWDGVSGHNVLWKTALPIHGYNSPVAWGDHLFLSGASNTRRVVYCLDRHNGQILWEREVTGIPGSPATPPRTTDDTGLAAPTLTVDGQHVVALFGTGDIIAFDLDGNRLWARNLGVPVNHYGHSSSLLTWDQKVFVQYDTQRGSRVMALDITSGETAWESPRSSGVSWASPILAKVDGAFQLVLLGNPDLSAYDPLTGEQLWSVDCMSGEVGVSPAYGNGRVYAANEYARMVAVDPGTGQQVWEDNYILPEVASLLVHDGLLYVATTYALLACFEAATGEFLWEYETEGSFYSSPMLADNKIYLFDTDGRAYVFRPGRTPELLASPELGEKVFSTPVFAPGRLYIRGNQHLYCLGNE
jgi:outer membrane protein assembly factor BamB